MKYIPYLYSLDGELSALAKQNFSSNICPLINIVKDKKTSVSSKSMLDDLYSIIKFKSSNNFLVNIPMNLELTKKKLKNPIEKFYGDIESNTKYQLSILKRFEKLKNVIPVIDVNLLKYNLGDLQKFRSQLNSQKVAYIFYAKKSSSLLKELTTLIKQNDILIYDLDVLNFYQKSVKNEIKQINNLKTSIGFKTLIIKQIYKDLTFFKLPNREILSNDPGYDCIDSDFFDDFSSFNFDHFGDHCGIRNIPIYQGGQSYPGFIGINTNNFSHFGFRGIEKDITSYSSSLLPNIINSNYWNNVLSHIHKKHCYGCSEIKRFNNLNILKNRSNPINNATAWKTITICHYISIIDYKLKNKLVN